MLFPLLLLRLPLEANLIFENTSNKLLTLKVTVEYALLEASQNISKRNLQYQPCYQCVEIKDNLYNAFVRPTDRGSLSRPSLSTLCTNTCQLPHRGYVLMGKTCAW